MTIANVWENSNEQELQEQEAYAAARGYFVKDYDDKSRSHYVFYNQVGGALARCGWRPYAIRIAYALAKTFSPSDA